LGIKVAVIGGGSTYTPELIEGFARRAGVLAVDELVLQDVAADRLEVVGGLARRILAAQQFPGRLVTTTSLLTGDGAHHYVDVRNDGTIAGLPAEAVVEVPALVDTAGPHPVPVDPLPPEMLGLVQAVTAYEVLAIEAARTGDRDTALRALLANPLVRQWDLAVPLLDALLEANRRHLPRFFAADG